MMKKVLWVLLAAIASACSTMSEDVYVPAPSDNIVNVGDRLPAFTVTMNDGRQLTTDSLRGKPSLIVFFSTTCPDCQRELPQLNQRYLEHGLDTTFVAISREQAAPVVTAYWKEHGLSLPFSAQADRQVYSLFARRGIPRIYVSDADGIVQGVISP